MHALNNIFRKPEIIVATLALVFGMVFIVVVRPLQTPDEAHHFIRAYQVSEGRMSLERAEGGSCIADGTLYRTDGQIAYSTVPESVTTFAGVIDRYAYSIKEQLRQPLNADKTVSVCGDQTTANSPIGYLPQALMIALLKPFNAAPILMDYAARLAVLITWTAFIYAAVKIIPVRKWAFVGLALLPIAVQQSIAMGPDVLSLAPAILFLAYLVRSYYENRQKFFITDLAVMGALLAVATLAKPIMILLVLLIPFYYVATDKKINLTVRQRRLLKLATILTPVIAWMIWGLFATAHHISTTDVFAPSRQHIHDFKDAPIQAVYVFGLEAVRYLAYDLSLWGYGSFEWFTKSMPKTFSYIGIVVLALMLLVSYDERVKPLKKITSKQVVTFKVGTTMLAFMLLFANIFTLYMIFTQPEHWMVMGMQFRYLLIVFFVLACVIETKYLRASEGWYRNLVLISGITLLIVSIATITGFLPPNI